MDNIQVYKQLSSLDELKELGYAYGQPDIEVYSNLEAVMEEKGLDVKDLSDLTGISRQTFHGILKKNRRVGIDVALKLSYVLNKPVDELFYLSDNSWFLLINDSEDLAIYLDHFNLSLISNKVKKELESSQGKDLYVNIETKEMKSQSELLKEDILSETTWRPRFERVIKYIKPIQL